MYQVNKDDVAVGNFAAQEFGDGTSVEGKVIAVGQNSISVKTDNATIRIPKDVAEAYGWFFYVKASDPTQDRSKFDAFGDPR